VILEHAVLQILPGREPEFEDAFARARHLIEASPGPRRNVVSPMEGAATRLRRAVPEVDHYRTTDRRARVGGWRHLCMRKD